MKKIILASKSPRRSELLSQLGIDFEVVTSDANENIHEKNPGEFVMQLSKRKADAVLNGNDFDMKETIIIGADTVVVYKGMILGKPKDVKDAFNMLKMLSADVHYVLTGVTLITKDTNSDEDKIIYDTFFETTTVHTYPMSDSEIYDYIATGEPMDKAGSYGIQGLGGRFIKEIEGDYNNVVGLPASKIYQKIKEM